MAENYRAKVAEQKSKLSIIDEPLGAKAIFDHLITKAPKFKTVFVADGLQGEQAERLQFANKFVQDL
jgi:hypothetical protein